jgi:hypothetical protein
MLTFCDAGDVPSESWIYKTFEGCHKIPTCWIPAMTYVCSDPVFIQALASASGPYYLNTLPDDIDTNGKLDDELFDGLHALDTLIQDIRDILTDEIVEDHEYRRGVKGAVAVTNVMNRIIAELQEKNRQYHHIHEMRMKESRILS